MADPLEINVRVNASELAALGEQAQSAQSAINSLAEQFAASGASSEELATAITDIASQLSAANPQIQNLNTSLLAIQTVQKQFADSIRETTSVIADAGGPENAENDLLAVGAQERIAAALAEQFRTQITQQASAAMQQLIGTEAAKTTVTAGAMAASQAAAGALTAEGMAAQAASNQMALGFEEAETASGQFTLGLGAQAEATQTAAQTAAAASQSLATSQRTAGTAEQQFNILIQQQIQLLGQQGASIQRAMAVLQAMGLTTQQATQAIREQGGALSQLLVQQNAATGGVERFTAAEAYSAVRMGSVFAGMGQLGFALARLVMISETLAPLLAKLFPAFAFIAGIMLIEEAIKKFNEWADAIDKAAAEQAKFQAELNKSAEAVDKINEKLAGQISPVAQLTLELANAGNKTVDFTHITEEANKVAGAQPAFYETWSKAVRDYYQTHNASASGAAGKLAEFNDQLGRQIQRESDIPGAVKATGDVLDMLTNRLNQAKTALANLQQQESDFRGTEAMQGVVLQEKATEDQIANYQKLIDTEKTVHGILTNDSEAFSKSEQEIQFQLSDRLLSDQVRSGAARLSVQTAQAKQALSMHQVSADEEERILLSLNTEKTTLETEAINTRIGRLKDEVAAKIITQEQATAIERDLEEQRKTITEEGTSRELEIETAANARRITEAFNTAKTLIQADLTITGSRLKAAEALQKISLARAETPSQIEAAAAPLIETNTELYNAEAEAIKKTADARIQAQYPVPLKPLTVDLGTDQFLAQIAQIKDLNEGLYRELITLNAEYLAKVSEGGARRAQIEEEVAQKVKQINAEIANNEIRDLQNSMLVERERYQDSAIAVQVSVSDKIRYEGGYYDKIAALAKQNHDEQMALLQEEVIATQNAMLNEGYTVEQGIRKIEDIYKREDAADKEMNARKLAAAKKEVEDEEHAIKAVTDKITNDFMSSFNAVLTGQETIGQAAQKLGGQLLLYIIDMGVKQVVEQWTESLVMMLAHESTFLSALLGIHTASASAVAAVDAAGTGGHAANEAAKLGATAASQTGQTAATTAGTASREGVEHTSLAAHLGRQTVKLITHVATEIGKTAATIAGETARGAVETAHFIAFIARKGAEVAAHVAAELMMTATTIAGAFTRLGAIIATHFQVMAKYAAEAAAAVYAAIAPIPFIGPFLAPVMAAAAFAAVLAFKEGGEVNAMQPVLVHGGELIAPQETIGALSNSSTRLAPSAMAHRVGSDQIVNLGAGMVVIPKGLAGGMQEVISERGGTIGSAEGEPPPRGLREIPQSLSGSMSRTITQVIQSHRETKQAMPAGGAHFVSIPAKSAMGGYVFSARDGVWSAAGGFSGLFAPMISASAATGMFVPRAAAGPGLPPPDRPAGTSTTHSISFGDINLTQNNAAAPRDSQGPNMIAKMVQRTLARRLGR